MANLNGRTTQQRKKIVGAVGAAPKIYAIGRVNDQLRTRFGITDNTLTEDDLQLPSKSPIRNCEFQGYRYKYVGPYTVSCDHRCAHEPYRSANGKTNSTARGTGSHGSAVDGCIQPSTSWSMDDVHQRSLDGIQQADHVFAWLEDHEAFGSLVEVGYASALGKPILIAHPPHIDPKDELWFAFQCATTLKCFESASAAYGWFLQLVGQSAEPTD